MTIAPPMRLALGSIAFAVFWVTAVFPSNPLLPIGRTAGSLLGSTLMVIFQVTTPTLAYDSIDLSILALLFGTMVISVYLDRADAFKYLSKLLTWKSIGPKDLICRVCIVSALTSAFFTNDTCCVVLTEFVLKLAIQQQLPPHPFLIALASSANIGSSATAIGSPQNLVIAESSGISFWTFLVWMFPAMLLGVAVNIALLLSMYWTQLSAHEYEEVSFQGNSQNGTDLPYEEVSCQGYSQNGTDLPYEEVICQGYSHNGTDLDCHSSPLDPIVSGEYPSEEWKRMLWKCCVYFITFAMLISLVMGLNMSWTAITAALALVVLDYKDAQPCLDKVSYSLLVLFCGMFMTMEGFEMTGIPSCLWNLVEPYARINNARGLTVIAVLITILSNLISNVPTVLLLGERVAESAAEISPEMEKVAWLTLAWVSTVSGNLSLVGSAANMIVCEQARLAPLIAYNLSFWTHLKFGVPSTLLVTMFGLILIR